MGTEGCQDWLKEIVLTDYTEAELLKADPKLIVLAPFTLSDKIEKAKIIEKGQEWGRSVKQVFPSQQQQEALDILGLFVLNRFRTLKHEEVMAMLNFDLMDTVAGRQIHEMGLIEDAREMVIEALDVRFGIVPTEIIEQIRAISKRDWLKSLLRQAIISSNMNSFKEILSKALPSQKTRS
jgi:hypothetical protein